MRMILCVVSLCLAATSVGQTPLNVQHTVQKGETLYKISRDYGMTVAEIRELNPNTSVIQPGMKLNVRKKLDVKPRKIPYLEHVVKKGETLYQISQKYQVKVSEIRDLNELTDNAIAVGMTLRIPGVATTDDVAPTKTEKTAPPKVAPFEPINELVEAPPKVPAPSKPDATPKSPSKPAENKEIKGGIIEKSTSSNKTIFVSKTESRSAQPIDTTNTSNIDIQKAYVWLSGVPSNQVICIVNPQNEYMTYALSQPKLPQQPKESIYISPMVAQKLGIKTGTQEVTLQYVVPKP